MRPRGKVSAARTLALPRTNSQDALLEPLARLLFGSGGPREVQALWTGYRQNQFGLPLGFFYFPTIPNNLGLWAFRS